MSWINDLVARFSGNGRALTSLEENILAGLVVAAICSAAAATWVLARRLVARFRTKRTERAIAAQKAREIASPKLGFAEALLIEEQVLADLPKIIPVVGKVVSDGVSRQESIKKRASGFAPNAPNAKQQFAKYWVDHADNLNLTARQLRRHTPELKRVAETLHQCQECYAYMALVMNNRKPNEKWLKDYDVYVDFRQRVRALKESMSPESMEQRWKPEVRAMHTKLDRAVKDFVRASSDLSDACGDLEAMCDVPINAVERWRNRSWFERLAENFRVKK